MSTAHDPAAPRRIVLIRHGQTDWNIQRRFQGHRDVPLNAAGTQQAARLADGFPKVDGAILLASDLGRAQQTAAPLAAALHVPITPDAGFRESDVGWWEGLSHAEIAEQDGERLLAWRSDHTVRPGSRGETRAEVGARMHGTTARYLPRVSGGGALLIVSHGGAIRCLVGALTGIPVAHWAALAVLQNCAWAELIEQPAHEAGVTGWRLSRYNVVADDRTAALPSVLP